MKPDGLTTAVGSAAQLDPQNCPQTVRLPTVFWMALPPSTPVAVIEAYQSAYGKMAGDPAFLEQGRRFSQEFSPVRSENLDALVGARRCLHVTIFMQEMPRRQGRAVN